MVTKKLRLKNYTSHVPVDASITIIRRSLLEHGATSVSFEGNDGYGNPVGMSFTLVVASRRLDFSMPVRVEHVLTLVEQAHRQMGKSLRNDALREQTMRTVWANVRDWTLAQMAIIDSNTVTMQEVFFPYMLGQQGDTMYNAFEKQYLLPSERLRVEAET